MFEYRAKVLRVVDGDTLEVEIDLGFHILFRDMIRLYGVNTPETRGAKAKAEKVAGDAATVFVQEWVDKNPMIILRSHDARAVGQEKYGRWLAVVSPAFGGVSLNDELISSGHAVPLIY